MDFFGMGPAELLLVLVIAMIFLGPGKIADLARQMGKAVNSFRKASSEFTTTVNSELNQLKIEPEKIITDMTITVSHDTPPAKPYSPKSVDQVQRSNPKPDKPSDNIDSPGAGI